MFDIDKAYLLGNGFNSNAMLDLPTNVSGYSTLEQIKALQNLPMPSGAVIELAEKGINLTQEFIEFRDSLKGQSIVTELSAGSINILDRVLRRINTVHNRLIKDNVKRNIPILVSDMNSPESLKVFTNLLNRHNKYEGHLKSRDAVKNSIVDKITKVISAPSSQIWAMTPVDVKVWHDAVEEAYKDKGGYEKEPLNPYDMFSMYKQQRDASVGKDDVGIAANGLKVFFALSSYYNDYYASMQSVLENDPKLFNKRIEFGGEVFDIASVSDVDTTNAQKKLITTRLGKVSSFLNSGAALYLSSFTSAATDNAKELLMAKVNANVELASMHIYLMILGLTPVQIVKIMTSNAAELVVSKLTSNMFFKSDKPVVNLIIDNLISSSDKDSQIGRDLVEFKSIFNGAQEVKSLAKLLGVNQKTSANTEEIHKYLSTYETVMYSRENQVLGFGLKDMATWERTRNSENSDEVKNAELALDKVVAKINKNCPHINTVEIRNVLKKASAINISYVNEFGERVSKVKSLLCGKFDYRYYVDNHPDNDEYRKVTTEYYNLIKDTFNIFDITSSVPHFKKMIEGVATAHQVLLYSSSKYNYVFNILKEYSREYSSWVSQDENVKNIMGVEEFPVKLTDDNIRKGIIGLDMRIKSKWLKTEDVANFGLEFNLKKIFNTINTLISENEGKFTELEALQRNSFKLYTSDDARIVNNVKDNEITIPLDTEEDYTISLTTSQGIANFKRLMEDVLLPLLKTKSGVLTDSLRLTNGYNLLGLYGSSITSTFGLSSLNNPVSIDKFQKLLKEFNELDTREETKELIQNNNNDTLKWRDLFYLYNLIVNNEKYGDLRLTPIFQDYVKEPDSLGFSYIDFYKQIDSGSVNILTYESDLELDPEYRTLAEKLDTIEQTLEDQTISNTIKADFENQRTGILEEMQPIKERIEREFINDILFYAFNTKGRLFVKKNALGKGDVLESNNPDFAVVASLTTSQAEKKRWVELEEVKRLLFSRGFLIKFEC